MNIAKINNTEIKFPSNWDEINKSQLLLLIYLYFRQLPTTEIKIQLLFKMLNLKIISKDTIFKDNQEFFLFKQKSEGDILISNLDFNMLISGLDFLFFKKDKTEYINSELTNNLIPKFYIKGKHYYGPDDKLMNLTWDEYMQADSYFDNFIKTNNENELDKLIACLYRSKDKSNKKRKPFNINKVDYNIKIFSKLNFKIKYAIYLYFIGCKIYLKKIFDMVFINKGNNNDSPNNHGYLNLNDTLSKEFADSPDNVRKYMLYDVLERLQNSMKTQIELEKKYKL